MGKTALFLKCIENIYDTNKLGEIGIDFKIIKIEIENIKINLQIYDTSGVERLKALTNSYCKGAYGIMLKYDVTYEKSFSIISN